MDLIGPAIACALSLESPVTATLPSSQSYLKIINVPYFITGSSDLITPAHICDIMGKSHMASSFSLANTPRMMQNSQHSDTATVWFDIINSQLGAAVKHLIGTSFQIGPALCFVHAA
jgi:hypothetical protein